MMLSLIPKPQHLQLLQGDIQFSAPLQLWGINGAEVMLDRLPNLFGELFHPSSTGSNAQLRLEIDPDLRDDVGAEGYRLNITTQGATISSAESAGLFYGLQTFKQLLPPDPAGEVILPCLVITDQPRFEWRGFMLDEARHFFGKQTVKRVLDWLAFFKINRFH